MFDTEYTASDIRKILQELFPHRRLVLSQFTFFNQVGVAKPTGTTFRRGRRCYRLPDVLSIACVLALKEEGIPLKNIETVPNLLQEHADQIFRSNSSCRLSGFGKTVHLQMPGEDGPGIAIEDFLVGGSQPTIFWSFDVWVLAGQLSEIARLQQEKEVRQAA